MSLYPFLCRTCNARDELHARVGTSVEHPDCPNGHGRMARDYSSFRPKPSTTPTRTGHDEVIAANEREARWAKDLPAYKRLRQQGLRPKSTEGAALMEAISNTRLEVEHGYDSPPAVAARAGHDVELEGSSA